MQTLSLPASTTDVARADVHRRLSLAQRPHEHRQDAEQHLVDERERVRDEKIDQKETQEQQEQLGKAKARRDALYQT